MGEALDKSDTRKSCCPSKGNPNSCCSSLEEAGAGKKSRMPKAAKVETISHGLETSAQCCGKGVSRAAHPHGRTLAMGALGFLVFALISWAILNSIGLVKVPTAGISSWGKEVVRILDFVVGAAWNLLPYFILSIVLAGWLKVSGLTTKLQMVFENRQVYAIVLSSLLGALSPFCSCGVIPIIASMLVAGVPLAPIMSFWISSPLMNPEVFFITAGTLGMSMALARLVTTIIMGLAAGFVTMALVKMGYLQDQLRPGIAKSCGCSNEQTSCASSLKSTSFLSPRWRTFIAETVTVALFLGKWLLVAFVLEALIKFYVPDHWIYGLVGSQNRLSVLIAALIGIPAYMNSLAAIPVVHGLVQSGMDYGAALAFFTAGAVTTIPAMVAVFALVRRPVFVVYLSISFTGAVTAGTLYSLIN